MYQFLRFYIHCTSNILFCISAHVREAASTNVLLVLYNNALQGFIPWMNQFLNESSEPVIQRSIQMPCVLMCILSTLYALNSIEND